MVTHDIPTKNLIADAVCGVNLDNGAKLVLLTAVDVEVATITLDNDAFAAAANGESQANNFPKEDTVDNAGTITKFEVRNSTNIAKIFGTVTTIGNSGDIELSSVAYVVGEIIRINSLTYRVPN
jgi:hypothetical protein